MTTRTTKPNDNLSTLENVLAVLDELRDVLTTLEAERDAAQAQAKNAREQQSEAEKRIVEQQNNIVLLQEQNSLLHVGHEILTRRAISAEAERDAARQELTAIDAVLDTAELSFCSASRPGRIEQLMEKIQDLIESQENAGVSLGEQWEATQQELERLRRAAIDNDKEIARMRGKVPGYPWPQDDDEEFPGAIKAEGIFAREPVAESLAMEAATALQTAWQEADILRAGVTELEYPPVGDDSVTVPWTGDPFANLKEEIVDIKKSFEQTRESYRATAPTKRRAG